MLLKYFLLLIVVSQFISCSESDKSKVLSRRKRYVSFPEGSSFSIAGCVTVGVIGQPAPTSAPGTFTFSANWAIAYELPNTTETVAFYEKKKGRKAVVQRRNRRNLYTKLEAILNDMGYNGRQCILKTLCETAQRIIPRGNNMMEEIFRTMFSMPVTKLVYDEPLEHAIYDSAHRLGNLLENCDAMFNCPVSMVDLVKGYYNAPAPTENTAKHPWHLFSSTFGMIK